jgi:hypothetical protein
MKGFGSQTPRRVSTTLSRVKERISPGDVARTFGQK